jgi:hypothetical protein
MIAATTFDYVRALLVPAGLGALCVIALVSHPGRRARWLVPLMLASVVFDVVRRPHVLGLSVLGIMAAVVATVACLKDRKHLAVAGTLICSASISVSLLIGLSAR